MHRKRNCKFCQPGPTHCLNLANQYYRGTECIRKQNVWPGNLMQVIYLAPQLIHTSMYKMYNVLAIILLQVPFMSATDCISGMIEYGMTHTSNRQYVFNLVLDQFCPWLGLLRFCPRIFLCIFGGGVAIVFFFTWILCVIRHLAFIFMQVPFYCQKHLYAKII